MMGDQRKLFPVCPLPLISASYDYIHSRKIYETDGGGGCNSSTFELFVILARAMKTHGMPHLTALPMKTMKI